MILKNGWKVFEDLDLKTFESSVFKYMAYNHFAIEHPSSMQVANLQQLHPILHLGRVSW